MSDFILPRIVPSLSPRRRALIAWSVCVLQIACGAFTFAQQSEAGLPLVINEFMASNGRTLADPQSEYDDWIEIYNAGAVALDMAGMYLTDDLDEPTKWRIPANRPELTTIVPGDHILIWADGDVSDEPGLHAGFSIRADGEQLGLFDTDGSTLIDAVTFSEQRPDVSFGRYPDASDNWQHMARPTPGAGNRTTFEGFVEEVAVSHDRGFYDRPFLMTLTCDTEGAEIWFTTDGSEPYVFMPRWITGTLYTEPIAITTTTCLRVKAVKSGWASSTVRTYTYIFLDDVLQQPVYPAGFPHTWGEHAADYEMDPDIVNHPLYAGVIKQALLTHRTISLTFDVADVFGYTNGIYAHPQDEGDAWERPVSVEIIDPCDGAEIQVNAGIEIQGAASSSPSRPKHNLRLLFRSEYGPTKLEYPLFEGWPVERFDAINLRGSNGDSWYHPTAGQRVEAQYIRDQWRRDTQYAMDRLAPGQGYAHVYLNGLYWGLYHLIERPDASLFAEHLGGDDEEYDVLKHKNQTVAGDRDAWNTMMAIANGQIASAEAYTEIQQYLDLPNLIDFMLVNFFIGNTDWDHNNWYGGRRRVPGAGFAFFTWDTERSFLGINDNITGKDNSNQPTHAHQRLATNADYRMLFADHVYRHFFHGGVLTTDGGRDRWLKRAEEIRLALVAESARWGDAKRPGDPYTPDEEWQAELDFLCNEYFPRRPGIVLNQLKARNLYPSVEPPTLSQRGGHVEAGFQLGMSAPAGTVWFTVDGSDPRLLQTAQTDVAFQTLVSEDASKRVLVPTGDVSGAWRGGASFDDSAWLAVNGRPGGVGYETSSGYESYISADVGDLMYEGDTTCYLRIPFDFGRAVNDWDAMTLRIRYDDGFVAYLNGVEISRRNFEGQPSWNSAADTGHADSEAREFENIDVSDFLRKLHPGENILAIHGMNTSSTSSDFLISVELELSSGGLPANISPTAQELSDFVSLETSTHIKTRALSGSTWSALNEAVFAVGPVAESLRISEIMYHPADPNAEYVELTNIGAETIDLNLVRFTNGIDITFPSFELAPGEYCLVVKDQAAFEAKYGSGLNVAGQYSGSLGNGGERIELQDAAGEVIHDFRFDDDWFGITDGLGFSLTVRDPLAGDLGSKSAWRPSANIDGSPGYDDAGIIPELGSVVINELLANSTGGEPDWIELHNTTDQAIDLGGWFLSDDANDLTKYEIAAGTMIAAGGYLVFDQDHHFGNAGDPGCHESFALSADGETVYLHSGSDGTLSGYSEQEKFDASEPGVSLGRYEKSTGTYNFVALIAPTPGAVNADPLVGPIVISEIMYHSPASSGVEYVELLNIGDAAVTLYDAVRDAPWRFTDDPDNPGIEFLFPTDHPVTLVPGESLILTKDAALLTSSYTIPANVPVFAWGAGNLANDGEKLQLSKPGAEDDGQRHWIHVDRVVYSDGVHPEGNDPWPTEADGQGSSLTRLDPTAYGNDPVNWHATAPSPGL